MARHVRTAGSMSLARPVVPGQTVLITRRCSERRFFLLPAALINQVLLYCLAVAAERYGMLVHAVCFMSNHWHVVLTDVFGNRPEFCRWFHEFTAKCLNVVYGRWENVWATEPTSVVTLVDDQAQLEKTVYTLCNPVEAGLVERGDTWPGVRSRVSALGEAMVVKRPKVYFSENGPLPEQVALRLHKLPGFAHLSDEAYLKRISEAVDRREAELRAQMRAAGRTFWGAKKVCAQSPFERPKTHEPRREMSPRVACRNKWARIEALGRLKAFVDSYTDAWQRYREGKRDVVFPHGTYWLRVYASVTCSPG